MSFSGRKPLAEAVRHLRRRLLHLQLGREPAHPYQQGREPGHPYQQGREPAHPYQSAREPVYPYQQGREASRPPLPGGGSFPAGGNIPRTPPFAPDPAPEGGTFSPRRFWVDLPGMVVSRVAMFVVLFFATLAFESGSLPRSMVLAYGLSLVLSFAAWLWRRRSAGEAKVGFLLSFQLLLEIGAESAIFLGAGGFHSDYGLLFILTILTAGLSFGHLGSFPLAALALAVLSFAASLHAGLWSWPSLGLAPMNPVSLRLRFGLFAGLFFATALLSARLSRRQYLTAKALEGTSRVLDLLQFSAENMMNNLPTGLLFADPAGVVRYFNAAAGDLLGVRLEPGQALAQVFPAVPRAQAFVFRILTEGAEMPDAAVEFELGGDRQIHALARSLRRDGHHMGFILTLFDFSERRRMERALLRSERLAAIGEMSARMAHEIRNPLASISGAAQMLRDAGAADEADRKLLGLVVSESERLNRLLTSLLDYAREKTPVYRPLSVAQLFKKVRMVLEKNPSFKKNLVSISDEVENGDIRIQGDQDILFETLLNLGLNSLQALPPSGGKVEFSAAKMDSVLFFEVRDTGCGISEEAKGRVFEPFYTTKPAGTGLGLSTCLRYVQSMEGSIKIESLPEGGTSVSFSLPHRPS